MAITAILTLFATPRLRRRFHFRHFFSPLPLMRLTPPPHYALKILILSFFSAASFRLLSPDYDAASFFALLYFARLHYATLHAL